MNTVLILNTILFGLLALIWKSSDWFNFLIKFILIVATVSNAIMLSQVLGYVVKA